MKRLTEEELEGHPESVQADYWLEVTEDASQRVTAALETAYADYGREYDTEKLLEMLSEVAKRHGMTISEQYCMHRHGAGIDANSQGDDEESHLCEVMEHAAWAVEIAENAEALVKGAKS